MDGAIAASLIAVGSSLAVNGVGWDIMLYRSSNQDSKLRGAFEERLKNICNDVEDNKTDIKENAKSIKATDDRLTSHIIESSKNQSRRRR